MITSLLYTIRHAWRRVSRDPVVSVVAALSIALGVGANASIFSLVDQVLLRSLPVKDPQQLVLLDWKGEFMGDGWGSGNLMSYPLCLDLQASNEFFDGVFCRHPTTINVSTGLEPRPVAGEIVSGSYFQVLGVRAALGRLLEPSDDVHPGAHPVVVISFDYWKSELGSAPDVVGRKIFLNKHPLTVVGVADAGFRGVDPGEATAVWIPTMMKRHATPEWDRLFDRRARWLHVFGRLKPGVTPERAKAGLQPWFKAMLEADTRREGWPQVTEEQRRTFLASTLDVLPASQGRSSLRRSLERPLLVLMAGTGLILLLACLNVANVFLARTAARTRDLATRMALGGSRLQIARELLAESLLIALFGGLLGFFAAPTVTEALLSFLPPNIAAVDLSSEPDQRVFLFSLLITVLTGSLCGLAPAFHAGRVPLIAPIREGSGGTSAGGIKLRRALVISQVAFALVLLTGAGLFVQTLARLHAQGPGFSTAKLVMFQINPYRNGYTAEAGHLLLHRLLVALKALPGIESGAMAGIELLTGGSWNGSMTIEAGGRRVSDRSVHFNTISEGFFGTLGTRLVEGRDFDERDIRESREPGSRPVIINESLARRYFADRSPLGHRLGIGAELDLTLAFEIVGVVRDFSYRGLREQTEQAFFPASPDGYSRPGTFYLRVRGDPESAFASIRKAVQQVDPALPILSLRTVEEQIDRSLTNERLLATLSSAFGVLAIILAVVGVYGVMSFVVVRRTKEIGIRVALGASHAKTAWLVLRDVLVMVAAGVAASVPAIWGLSRLVESQLYGVDALDPWTITGAAALLASVAIAAASIPARRAVLIDPTVALRSE